MKFKDKPLSMSDKEYIMRALSIKTNTPLVIIEAIIDHQFSSTHEALKSNFSVEISGFGKFIYKRKGAIKKLEKNLSKKRLFEGYLNSLELDVSKRTSIENKLRNTIEEIEILKGKLNVTTIEDNRGVEESSITP